MKKAELDRITKELKRLNDNITRFGWSEDEERAIEELEQKRRELLNK